MSGKPRLQAPSKRARTTTESSRNGVQSAGTAGEQGREARTAWEARAERAAQPVRQDHFAFTEVYHHAHSTASDTAAAY
eukprot:6085397-Pleurochrysis_carterae.AAC.2